MVDLSRSQREIQKAARAFAKGEFDKDQAQEMDRAGTFPEKIRLKAAELGFCGIHFPEQYGGGGLGLLESVLVAESFCRQDATIGCALTLSGLGAECLLYFGSEELKRRFLPTVAEGRAGAGTAFGESGSRAEPGALQATARPEGDGWWLEGAKDHVLNCGQAAFYIVGCRTGPDKLSLFVVENGQPGLSVQPDGRKLGLNPIHSGKLLSNGLMISAANLVGREGQGLAQMERFLETAHVLTAAQAVGIAGAAFDRALAYVKERQAFGRKLAQFEITRDKIADMAIRVETARQLAYQAAHVLDGGARQPGLAAMANLVSTQAAVAVADEAIQLFGGYGYMQESEVERFYRDAKTLQLLLGAASKLKKQIAATVLK